ncbi:hypothetical protein [Noviherbaspirillum sp.]|uniref:hypothetical protein n=1 Tax=Noviherbaspirillum sp. TaxID=1926288 RepID=UPI002FE0F553
MEDVENNLAVVELFIRCIFIVLSIYVIAAAAVFFHWLLRQDSGLTSRVPVLEPSGRTSTK